MILSDFRLLSLSQQASTVLAFGVLLDNRYRDDLYITLYQINNFYIEVYIHQNSNQIVGFSSFTNVDDLDPYLKKIDISAVLPAL